MPLPNNNIVRQARSEKIEIPVLVTATLAIMDELTALLAQEIDLVPARQIEKHAELLKRKQRLTMDYRANIKSFAAQPDILKPLSDGLRAKIKDSAQKLAEMTDRNAKMLRTAVVATQRLIQNIVTLVKKEVMPIQGYKNPNTAHMALGTYSPTCKPVAGSRTA
jgi:hypothetical protein